jgi:gamma-glutamyltranspeptidase
VGSFSVDALCSKMIKSSRNGTQFSTLHNDDSVHEISLSPISANRVRNTNRTEDDNGDYSNLDMNHLQLYDDFHTIKPGEDKFRNRMTLMLILAGIITVLLIVLLTQTLFAQNNSGNDNFQYNDPTLDVFHVTSTKGAVATDSTPCSQIGANVLSLGGNAVDAAIAATLCLGVVSPASSGIGGGCFIVVHNHSTGVNDFIDAREVAPAAATPTMFEDEPQTAQDGGLAVAVLAELRGLHLAYTKYSSGNLSWAQLIEPAAVLAENWYISNQVGWYIKNHLEIHLKSGKFPALNALYMKDDGSTIKVAGDSVQQPLLAKTLRNVGELGPDYLYTTMASSLAADIQAAGGIVTEADITAYAPIEYPALEKSFMGHQYIGAQGCSSGGPVVAGILGFMDAFAAPMVSLGSLYYHYLVEGMKHGFAMRLHLADPGYMNDTDVVDALVSDAYMGNLAAGTSTTSVLQELKDYGGKYNMTYILPKDQGTTHISVIDSQGNAVSLTSTVNTYFGSKVISPSTGILFNNQMDDFSIPGASNYFGLAPSPANYPEPFKRPLSSMSPSVILDSAGKVVMAVGASGGPKIITATLQVRTACVNLDIVDSNKQ